MSNQEIMQKIEAVNKLLLEGEPENISVDDHGGTTYTGYKPQYLIDAMNQVFDIGAWGFEEVSSEITPGEKGLAIAQVKVWIEGVKAQPVGWGQNRVTRGDIGDARKGAQTDAIKKALSYFSIGNRAYRGLLPNPKQQQPARPAQNAPRPMSAQQVPAKSQQNGASMAVVPTDNAQSGYLLPAEIELLKKDWIEVCNIKEADIPKRWTGFKAYIADGAAVPDTKLTREHKKAIEAYIEPRRKKAS